MKLASIIMQAAFHLAFQYFGHELAVLISGVLRLPSHRACYIEAYVIILY